jgi:hypothetical protein
MLVHEWPPRQLRQRATSPCSKDKRAGRRVTDPRAAQHEPVNGDGWCFHPCHPAGGGRILSDLGRQPAHNKIVVHANRDFKKHDFTHTHTHTHDSHHGEAFLAKNNDTSFSTSPPAHLSKESAAWFKRTVALYLFDEHHIKLLTLACEAFDRAVQARKGLEQHEPITSSKAGGLIGNRQRRF